MVRALLSLLEPGTVEWKRVLSSRQVTDLYLLALAIQHGGRFVTLDRRIDPTAISAAEEATLVVIET